MKMSIIQQYWKNQPISFTQSETKISKRNVPAGYVNLTQMCNANEKQVFHWKENKRSKAFMKVLSCKLGIPVELLIFSIGARGQDGLKATWGHRRVAINVAQWISPEFDVWVSGQVEKLFNINENSIHKEKEFSLGFIERAIELDLLDMSNSDIKMQVQERFAQVYGLTLDLIDECSDKSWTLNSNVVDMRSLEKKESKQLDLNIDGFKLIPEDNLITQEEFASIIGVCRTSLWRWEKNVVEASIIAPVYFGFSNKRFLNQFQQKILIEIKKQKILGFTNKQIAKNLDAKYDELTCDLTS